METMRLILRKPLQSDLDAALKIRNSEYVLRYNAMAVIGKEELAKSLNQGAENNSVLHIESKENHELIGSIFIEPDSLRYKVQSVCLSYYLGESYCGKGYMSEALGEVLRHLFFDRNMDIVSARAFSPNTASQSLLKKLGFAYEGTLRHCVCGYGDIVYDDMVFSMLKSEFG